MITIGAMIHMRTEDNLKDLVPAMETFVENLRGLIDVKGISQAEIATKANVGRAFLSRLLAGKGGNCTISTAAALADAVGQPLWKLMRPVRKMIGSDC